jgi:NAD(P)-dependent dehydrogenase (short-subunit alcohol dehydrogenase family)
MTKHAVVGFVRSLSPSLMEKGITFNAILPGVVETNLLADGFADKARAMGISVIPPEQIADGVVKAVTDGTTGQLWLCLADREPEAYAFNPVGGLGIPADIEG